MRIPKGPYQESFPIGSIVCIASRETLEEFERTWKFHNKLQPGQLNYAGKSGKVLAVGFRASPISPQLKNSVADGSA
jgi:hypothetical protein